MTEENFFNFRFCDEKGSILLNAGKKSSTSDKYNFFIKIYAGSIKNKVYSCLLRLNFELLYPTDLSI